MTSHKLLMITTIYFIVKRRYKDNVKNIILAYLGINSDPIDVDNRNYHGKLLKYSWNNKW